MQESNPEPGVLDALAVGQEQRHERAMFEHVMAPPQAPVAAANDDRDAALWALADQLVPGETLTLSYRSGMAANAAVRARMELTQSQHAALDTRTETLEASFSLALAHAYPGFERAQDDETSFPSRHLLRPSVLPLDCDAPRGELRALRPRPVTADTEPNVVLLPRRPLHKARLAPVLAMLLEHDIAAEIAVHLNPVAIEGGMLRRIGEAQALLEARLNDPRVSHPESQRTAAYRELLSLYKGAGTAIRVTFDLGLQSEADPLLPEMAQHLLFGSRRQSTPGTAFDLSTILADGQPRVALSPDPGEVALLASAGAAPPGERGSDDDRLEIGRHPTGRTAAIAGRDLQRHVYLVGATGAGKSSLMADMIRQDVARGCSVVLMDPHGDLFAEVRAALPACARSRATIADVADFEHPFSVNLFEVADGPAAAIQRNFVCNQLIGIFKTALYQGAPEGFGPMFEAYFRNAALLLMEAEGANASLVDFDRVFGDAKYRRELLQRCRDETVIRFWRDVATRAGGEAALENIAPYVVSKLTRFTGNPLIREIVAGERPSLDFEAALAPGGVCLINLAKGSIGDTEAALIGSILSTRLFAWALGRARLAPNQRHPVRLYMDEFQTYATDALGHMLAESRKFGLELVLANQSLTQVGGADGRGVAGGILANVANILAFRVGPADARALSDWYAPEIGPLTLTRMPDFHFAARRLVAGRPAPPSVLAPARRVVSAASS